MRKSVGLIEGGVTATGVSTSISMKMRIFVLLLILVKVASGELYTSKKFGFAAMFPGETEAIPVKNAMGEMFVVSSAVVEEKPPKILIYQINLHKVTAMKDMPTFEDKTVYDLLEKNLKPYVTNGGGDQLKFERSKLSAWPALKFSCRHSDFFRKGVISYKHGFSILIKDTYYKIVVHSLEDNEELEAAALQLFASFTLLTPEQIELLKE